MDTEWVSPKVTQLYQSVLENNWSPTEILTPLHQTVEQWALVSQVSKCLAPKWYTVNSGCFIYLLPQCLEQYLVNEWMNNERMNNNEWMNEGVAKPKEALTHTLATQIAAFMKLHKIDFTNAFLLNCFFFFFFNSLAWLAINQSRWFSLTYFQS